MKRISVWATVLCLALVAVLAMAAAPAALAANGVWVEQTSGTTKTLRAIAVLDASTAWIAGDGGADPAEHDRRRDDVGASEHATRQRQRLQRHRFRRRVARLDLYLKGIRIEDRGRRSHRDRYPLPDVFATNGFAAIDFIDATTGVVGGLWVNKAVTKNPSLSVSLNGGVTWTNVSNSDYLNGGVDGLAWANSTTVWACGQHAANYLGLMVSRDRGTTWTGVHTDVGSGTGEPLGGVGEIDFLDSTQGWAVAGYVSTKPGTDRCCCSQVTGVSPGNTGTGSRSVSAVPTARQTLTSSTRPQAG